MEELEALIKKEVAELNKRELTMAEIKRVATLQVQRILYS
jgi:hypothetical protein